MFTPSLVVIISVVLVRAAPVSAVERWGFSNIDDRAIQG
jgi:hypothetical protein